MPVSPSELMLVIAPKIGLAICHLQEIPCYKRILSMMQWSILIHTVYEAIAILVQCIGQFFTSRPDSYQ
jgi:hypothetical protein